MTIAGERLRAFVRSTAGRPVLGVLALLTSSACASSPSSSPSSSPLKGLVVVVDGRTVHRGPAAYTVRVGDRHTSRVVTLRGTGEVIVDDDACRFARINDGGAVTVWRHDGACSRRRAERICFARAPFVDDAGRRHVVVDGCAEQNEIFLDRVGASDDDTGLGPRTLIERCVDVPARDPGYVAVTAVAVDDNDQPWRGLRLRHDGDGFGVCFLSRKVGRYRIDVVVEDPRRRQTVLQGVVDEL
jgi:hypothetical protein